eukprot:scaffold14217_cov127-Skeletonema_marinoi.AAC.3
MPKTAALSSIRRSSRSPVPPSSSSDSRSPDATAYQLLANQLEKEEWRQLSNRKGGFALVKKGHSIDDAVCQRIMMGRSACLLSIGCAPLTHVSCHAVIGYLLVLSCTLSLLIR